MITMENVKTTSRIFLSFAAPDRALALKLQRLLAQRPELRLFTTDSLSAGEDWVSRLKAEITNCDLFVTFLTGASVSSTWVLSELGAAWGLEKSIVAIVSQPEVLNRIPLDLRKAQVVTVAELERPETIDRLLKGLQPRAL